MRTMQSPRTMGGFGLSELMIAMVLGLIVIGAAFAIFQTSQTTFRSNEGLSRIQETARAAFELMSRDIRAAGGSSCSNFSVVEGAGAQTTRFRDSAVSGDANSLRVVSGDDTAYRVVNSTSTSVTLHADDIDLASDAFQVNDFLILCNARKTHVVQATALANRTVTFAALPGGYVPTADQYAPPAAVVLARFRDVNWFVGANTRGGSSLWVSRNGGAAEEVAEGVQNIAFTYLREGATNYVANPADWRDVIAVRITMTLQGADVDGNALTRTASNVVSMRGRTL
jgi:type IV pilus assembly protein PilW